MSYTLRRIEPVIFSGSVGEGQTFRGLLGKRRRCQQLVTVQKFIKYPGFEASFPTSGRDLAATRNQKFPATPRLSSLLPTLPAVRGTRERIRERTASVWFE